MRAIHIISFYLHLIIASAGVLYWASRCEGEKERERETEIMREGEREENYLSLPGDIVSCEEADFNFRSGCKLALNM